MFGGVKKEIRVFWEATLPKTKFLCVLFVEVDPKRSDDRPKTTAEGRDDEGVSTGGA